MGLITMDEVMENMETDRDFVKAKRKAVQKFLMNYLKFEQEEIDRMDIKETMVSAKGDSIIYVAFDEMDDIKEIKSRISECGIRDIVSRNFIPPGF